MRCVADGGRTDDAVRLIEHAHRELQFGAMRTRIWLDRVHRICVAAATSPESPGTSAIRPFGAPARDTLNRRGASVQPRPLLYGLPGPDTSEEIGDISLATGIIITNHAMRTYRGRGVTSHCNPGPSP